MTTQGLLVMVSLAGSTLWANASDDPMRSTVMVCMERGSPRILGHARNMVTKMFAGIDVEISWWGRRDCPLDSIRIILKVVTPPDEPPGVLAYAFPYEGSHIVILYDRVEQEVPQSRVPALMAHVIAHEIAHLLAGCGKSPIRKSKPSHNRYFRRSDIFQP